MPSNQYSGIPKVCLLYSTAGGKPIDLLNAAGICITNPPGWIPKISQLKGGGVRIASQSMDDEYLVAGGYESVSETFPITIDPIDTAARVQELLNRLWEAEQFWMEGWQQHAVYLKVQLAEDSDIRYSRIKTGSYQIGNYAFGGRTGLPNNTLILEREPAWIPVPPGEMIGPFRNMVQNPSFEIWGYDGIEDQIPSGWNEQIDVNFPANPVLSREELQVAGSTYSLDMTFAGAGGAAPNEWYLWQRVRLEPVQTYTLKVWINLTAGGGAGELFFIRIYDPTRAVLYLNQTFTVSQNGWYYFTFTTDRNWLYYLLELGFIAPATSVGSTIVIDRLLLTEGTWNADNWPGDFYISSSIVWNYWNPECHDYDAGVLAYAENAVQYFDITGMPGDFEAQARIALECVQYGNYGITQSIYAIVEKIAFFAEKRKQSDKIYINTQGAYGASTMIGASAINRTLPTTQTLIFSKQFSGDELTALLDHQYRVFVRTGSDKDIEFQVGYWVGSPLNEVLLDTYIYDPPFNGPFSFLELISPTSVINWTKEAVERFPAVVGFTIYAANDETGTADFYLDYVYLMPVDDGGAWCTELFGTGQALVLDSSSLSKPVRKGYVVSKAGYDVTSGEVGPVGGPFILSARSYANVLYLFYDNGAGSSLEITFNGTEWRVITMTYTGNPVMDTEIFNGYLYLASDNGEVTYYDFTSDTETSLGTIGGNPILYYIQKFQDELYLAASDGWVYSVIGGYVQVRNCGANIPKAMACYKHQLWVGCDNGVTHILQSTGWANGPVLPCSDDIVWMIEFQDKLFIACIDGDVYSWDGQAYTLSKTGTPANDDNGQQLEVYNDKLYLLTGGSTQDMLVLYETSDGATWTEVLGIDFSVAGLSIQDTLRMEVFAGRLAIGANPVAGGQWDVVWYAPLDSTINIPDHSGDAITIPPKDTTRIHALMQIEGRTNQQIDLAFGGLGVKTWILPRWRALRNN